ncbi:cytochrome b [Paraburkholderia lycopersici]|uniref:Cytochrome b561 n=1 Tax=Paraburkholderia lycopersici TaxID=416944 RepID=A0A1G6JFY8_9BURK|nr:cytochrome b [Paraburkholderia lycopersici]SDC17752.1 cytochrome b561 [Paraburkholderia lycopersici]
MATYPAATERYAKPAIFFHWAIFLLVALAYLAIEVRGPKGTDSRVFWSNVHFWAGSLVLTLAVPRLLWRLWHGAPADIDSNALLSFLSRLVHLALYLFIFVQPLLGILTVNTGGHPVTLTGIDLQITLVGPDPVARKFIKDAHELIGNLFYWVIGLHALAAIGHHVVFRDNTLRRMV